MNKRNSAIVIFDKQETTVDEVLKCISSEFEGDVIILGTLLTDGFFGERKSIKFNGRLFVLGGCYIGNCDVKHLEVRGTLNCCDIKVQTLIADYIDESDSITVSEYLFSMDGMSTNILTVAGDVYAENFIEAEKIEILGNLYCEGIISTSDLSCKGSMYCEIAIRPNNN